MTARPQFEAKKAGIHQATCARRRHFLPTSVALGLLTLASASVANAATTITVDASNQTAGNPHFWSAAFGTGKAKLALRGDWQTHYKIGNRELGAQRVRGHGLLNSGEMDLWKSAGTYDWKNLDTYLTAITTANMRPIIELDFMPTGLASSSSDAMHSPPKDYNEWKNFIKALAQHLVDKYGADDVGKWYFEVWNEPDYAGFWVNKDMAAYYTLYDNTVDALTAVIPNVLVGGPATTMNGPIGDFLKHCKSAGKRVTFASSHNYPGGANTGTSADANNLVSDNTARINAITGAGYTTADVKSFNTEWNSSYSGQGGGTGDAVTSMDNHWNVGFILKAAKLLSDQNKGDTPAVEVFSYWALTDVFDESSGTDGMYMSKNNGNTPFGTVFGVMTFQGMRKAAFNAFKLLNYTGPKRVKSAGGTGSDGIDAMATTSESGDSLQILVYNYYKTLNTASGSGDSVTINVSNLPTALANKKVFVTQFLVDEKNSNPYSVWTSQNKPATPSEEQWRAMKSAQHLALYPDTKVGDQKDVTTSFSTTFNLNKQAGTLIIVSTKRPVTGRNALVEIEGEDYDGQSSATKGDSGDSTTLGQSLSIAANGYAYYEKVDYTDDGVSAVQLRVKTSADANLEFHADKADGTLLAKCAITSTSGAWATQTCNLSAPATGVSTLYLVASGAVNLNWFKFQGSGGGGGTGGSGGNPSGTGGTAGDGVGGAKGGAGGNAGGAAGSANPGTGGSVKGGNTGTPNAGGSAGNPKGGSDGSGTGGSGDQGGASGGDGGAAGNGSGSGGSGGSSSSASGTGGSSGPGGAVTSDNKSGCGCRVGGASRSTSSLLLIGLAGVVLALRKRSRRTR
jgi:xylan 1,4-beta-xylosidase